MKTILDQLKKEIKFEIVEITPEMAEQYLATIWNYYIQKNYVKKVRYTMGEHVDFI